jgi:uncharacterized protein
MNARVVKIAEEGWYELIASEMLLSELNDVLRRGKFRRYFPEEVVPEYLAHVRRLAVLREEGPVVPVSPDPKDDYLVALMRSSAAEFLVSGDRHLLRLRLHKGEVIDPSRFIDVLQQRSM